MMNYKNLFLVALVLLLSVFTSCKEKDPCSGITCLNGGACLDGNCQCPAGTSGKNCEVKDPCYNVSCLNGGTCANGTCNCPTGYTGSDCSQQKTPTKIQITKIDIMKYPRTRSNGGGWDTNGTAADIFLKIYKGATVITTSPTRYDDASQDITYPFLFSTPIEITSPKEQYIIELLDYDLGTSDEIMQRVTFVPYSETNKFPETITYSCDAPCQLTFKVYLKYFF